MKHPLVSEWLAHPVTQLLYKLLDERQNELLEAIIDMNGNTQSEMVTEAHLKSIYRFIDELHQVEEFFPETELLYLGDK